MFDFDEKATKILIFETFAAGYVSGNCSKDDLMVAYNKYWESLIKEVEK